MRILVRGSGDVASAVAHRLVAAGYAVAIHDGPLPTTSRRRMAFTDAIFEGRTTLEGVAALRVDDLAALRRRLEAPTGVVVSIAPFEAVLEAVAPTVLVDARMRKRARPEVQRGLAPLAIGLGPNFLAGETVDLAIETSWEAPGRIVRRGPTLDLAGEPREIAGHARDRYVYAPAAGTFETDHEVGGLVRAGEVVARIGAAELRAPIDGALRGLTHAGVPVAEREKVIEVDPRGPATVVDGLGERPARIAAGVLEAVRTWAAAATPSSRGPASRTAS